MDLIEDFNKEMQKVNERFRDLESRLNQNLPDSIESERRSEREAWEKASSHQTFFLGTVVDSRDRFILGRVLVRIHGQHHSSLKEDKLEIVEPIHSFGGLDDSGSNWTPPVGSQVAMIYTGGMLGQYYYLGTVPHSEISDSKGAPSSGPRSIRLFDRRWAETYSYRQEGHLGSFKNESLPPWASENYRKAQRDAKRNQETAEPSIFGFKTPEKHLLKFCDGFFDEKLMGKRVVLQSSKGNLIYMKDDLLNKPEDYEKSSPVAQSENLYYEASTQPEGSAAGGPLRGNLYETYPILPEGEGNPWDAIKHTNNDHVIVSGTLITSGLHLNTPQGDGRSEPEGPPTAYRRQHLLEMSGTVFQSAMGHRLIFDDKFDIKNKKNEENTYPEFRRIQENEDLDSFVKLESISEHSIALSDHEEGGLRSRFNGIFIESALGNILSLCDHQNAESTRGAEMGVTLQSTTGHQIKLIDGGGVFESERRKKFGKADPTGEGAKLIIKSGFGQMIEMIDGPRQSAAGGQVLRIFQAPQPNGGGDANYIQMVNGSDGTQQAVFVKAAKYRIDITVDHHIRNVGGMEIARRNKGHIQINRNYGEDFQEEGGDMAPSLEFASAKYISTEGPIVLFGGNDKIGDSLDGTEADENGGAGGAADVEDESDKSIAPVLINAAYVVNPDGESPPPAIECPMLPGSGYGCIFIGQDKKSHVSPGVLATRQNPE